MHIENEEALGKILGGFRYVNIYNIALLFVEIFLSVDRELDLLPVKSTSRIVSTTK